MPEGPEVYVMSERFRKRHPVGTKVTAVIPLAERYRNQDAIPEDFLSSLPLTIQEVKSKGKKTIVDLGDWKLLISYGMSGHWEFKTSKQAQLEFRFKYQRETVGSYFWVSSRSLPTCVVKFLTPEELESQLSKLGWDIVHDNPTPEEVLDAYGTTRKNVCAFLMEQDKFCGIGNYIKAVILYRCSISPHRKIHELDDGEKWLLWETATEVAREAIRARGMGMRDYKDEDGKVMGVSFDITPYNKKKDKMGNKVVFEDIAGRRTWWVPAVQR